MPEGRGRAQLLEQLNGEPVEHGPHFGGEAGVVGRTQFGMRRPAVVRTGS